MESATTRHSHEDALSESQFEALVDGAKLLEPPWNLEALFFVFAAGRLGLRVGEIAHVERSWANFETGMIEIPTHSTCHKGRDGGPCGYCRRQARRAADRDANDYTFEELLESYWRPKTGAGVRAVPFDFSERVSHIVRAFFDYYQAVGVSVNTVRRRVGMAVEAAGIVARIYPHCLRSTAATHHAYNGLGVAALQAMLGWAKLATAEKYVRLSGGQTKRALENAYN